MVVTRCVHAFDKRSEATVKKSIGIYSSRFDGPVKRPVFSFHAIASLHRSTVRYLVISC